MQYYGSEEASPQKVVLYLVESYVISRAAAEVLVAKHYQIVTDAMYNESVTYQPDDNNADLTYFKSRKL